MTPTRSDPNEVAPPMPQAVPRLVALGLGLGLAVGATSCGAGGDHPSVAPLAQISVSNEAAQNGITDLSPAKALDEAIAAMEQTGSYRVSGTTTGGNTVNIAFAVGKGSVGSVSSGNPMKIRSVGGAVYVSGDSETMQELVGADVDGTIADKWLALNPESASGFEIFADGNTFAEAVLGADAPSKMTGVAEVDGELAVGLLFSSTGGTLWVAATGKPLPLRFEEKGASAGSGILTFSDFGAKVEIAKPTEDELLDIDKLPQPSPETDE